MGRGKARFPSKRVSSHDEKLRKIMNRLLGKAGLSTDFNIYCVDQRRGKCFTLKKFVTIPLWAVEKGEGYLTWYVAHELSHIFAVDHGCWTHGTTFMSFLKRICPKKYQHHEYGYKPRNAQAAGIPKKKEPKLTLESEKSEKGTICECGGKIEFFGVGYAGFGSLAKRNSEKVYKCDKCDTLYTGEK